MAVCSILPTASAKPATGYHLLKKFVLGGEGGWDLLAVDSSAHRLYISRSTHVMVVDADTGAIVGDITQKGARTLDLDQKTHRVFLVTAEFGPPSPPTAERPRPRPPMVPWDVHAACLWQVVELFGKLQFGFTIGSKRVWKRANS